jgi:DNA polymerase-3 subunit alpha
LTAQELAPLEQVAAEASTRLRLFLSDQAPLDSLKTVLGRDARAAGRGRIALILELDGGEEAEMELPGTYQLSSRLRQAIKAIPGLVVQEA